MVADQAGRFHNRGGCIADSQHDVVAEFFEGAAYACRRAGDALRVCHQCSFGIVYAAPGFYAQLFQQGAFQAGLHHRHVGHDALAAQQRAYAGFNGARRKIDVIDGIKIAAGMHQPLQYS